MQQLLRQGSGNSEAIGRLPKGLDQGLAIREIRQLIKRNRMPDFDLATGANLQS